MRERVVPGGNLWVSCSREMDEATASMRHLLPVVAKGKPGATTLCGAAASTGTEWRGNLSKPKCAVCENHAN